jgi:hypothetical protein
MLKSREIVENGDKMANPSGVYVRYKIAICKVEVYPRIQVKMNSLFSLP